METNQATPASYEELLSEVALMFWRDPALVKVYPDMWEVCKDLVKELTSK